MDHVLLYVLEVGTCQQRLRDKDTDDRNKINLPIMRPLAKELIYNMMCRLI